MRQIDEPRPLTAGRILEIWRMCRETSRDPLERTLICNARILAECCLYQGGAVYEGPEEVLRDLTGREIARLLTRLAEDDREAERPSVPPAENPTFDAARFEALKER